MGSDKWLVTNQNIWTGYRIGYNTHAKAGWSLFEWHNESINVWSHLLAGLVFIYLIFYVYLYMSTPEVRIRDLHECPLEHECTLEKLILTQEPQHNEPSIMHNFLNKDAEFVETIEQIIRHSLLSAQESLAKCGHCLERFVADIPSFVTKQVSVLGDMYNTANMPDFVSLKQKNFLELAQLV